MFLKQRLAPEMHKEHYWYLEFESILDEVVPGMERFGFPGQKLLRTADCFSGWPELTLLACLEVALSRANTEVRKANKGRKIATTSF